MPVLLEKDGYACTVKVQMYCPFHVCAYMYAATATVCIYSRSTSAIGEILHGFGTNVRR